MHPFDETDIDSQSSPEFVNREISWLRFARRVLSLVEDEDLPLLERVKFAGITGTLHDEFTMKRLAGLRRKIPENGRRMSRNDRRTLELLSECRDELERQEQALGHVVTREIMPALAREGVPIESYRNLSEEEKSELAKYFHGAIQPILTPLAVDAEHPFPFISSLNLNLAVAQLDPSGRMSRFVRIKVPNNRPRWVPIPGRPGFVPLEQIIAANLAEMFPGEAPLGVYVFRVTRGAEAEEEASGDLSMEEAMQEPGSIVRLVSSELKARRFAGVARLHVERTMPPRLRRWLAAQLGIDADDVSETDSIVGFADFQSFTVRDRNDLRYPTHVSVVHERLRDLAPNDPAAIFSEIAKGDVLLHHPYHSFDASVAHFIASAALDPAVLAIKLTIYRTSSDSPIVKALAAAARRGKQVAVLVEITARFDEAPNIAWGKYLEEEGAHVAYGVERLKTHVKLALVVREEADGLKQYAHVGTGNYHSITARMYEDVGVLTAEPDVCADVAAIFNSLTGSTPPAEYLRMIVAPYTMRSRFVELIRREADHAKAGRPSGICAKMNQLQDPAIIRELYNASRAGVPVTLIVRGLCCLRPGVANQSETIRVYSVVGRFLEHSRIYRFENAGEPEFYVGSADWMRRNLDFRVESIVPVLDETVRKGLDDILAVYDEDNCSAWDALPSGEYRRRVPAEGDERRSAQEIFIERAKAAFETPAPSEEPAS